MKYKIGAIYKISLDKLEYLCFMKPKLTHKSVFFIMHFKVIKMDICDIMVTCVI